MQSSLTVKERQAGNFEIEEKKLQEQVNKLKTEIETKKRESDELTSKISQIR